MPVVKVQSFKGIAPRVPARYLENGQAQVAVNCPVFSGSIQPLKDVGPSLLTLDKVGSPGTIYRYGQDTVSDTQYWFHWTSDVDVCRSQIAADTSEWTFFTGDGAPKATNASIALSGTDYPAASRPLGIPAPETAISDLAATFGSALEASKASLTVSAADIATFPAEGFTVWLARGGLSDNYYIDMSGTPSFTVSDIVSTFNATVNPRKLTAAVSGSDMVITTAMAGFDMVVAITWADGAGGQTRSSRGDDAVVDTLDTRVYTYTWVSKDNGYEFESAPAPASDQISPLYGQTVTLQGFDTVPTGGYNVTHKRIYRSTAGIYLYVGETTAAASDFVDDVPAEALGEQLPSLNWTDPPDDLEGLTNLPNGMMAGFVGRDVYFCEPYRPHAWPEVYMQTVDYPVVGLGRMDTTLAVLTTGVPYLMQGTHPDSIAVVKSDLEQACVSKKSIVSFGSAVVYAAPDGLMMLSSGGSRIITEGLFNYEQWQTYFAPESIHAYQNDNQYIAFYDNGSTQGGFIYDMKSGQFILHDIYAVSGYRDLQRDKLFLAFSDRSIKVWQGGSTKAYTWKSKKFTMPEPMSFSCAQLEAETYPVTMTVILDGATLYSKSVSSRNPFRLPAKPVGRDWEILVEGGAEVFSVALGTSMTELANG